MTEEEWFECADPTPMLGWVGARIGTRKLRLFACACSRMNWDSLSDRRYRAVIELGERLADGAIPQGELDQVRVDYDQAVEDLYEDDITPSITAHLLYPAFSSDDAEYCAWHTTWMAGLGPDAFEGIEPEIKRDQADFLRDVVGDPFRSIYFDPRWRTADVMGMARGIYEERAFDRLPILADALMDAGCEDAAILAHCRGPGPHVRGCWVVDLVLGKE